MFTTTFTSFYLLRMFTEAYLLFLFHLILTFSFFIKINARSTTTRGREGDDVRTLEAARMSDARSSDAASTAHQ
jgi:hypothetical protein